LEEEIIELAGTVAIWFAKIFTVCVAIAGSAWGIWLFLGKKWIENKFQKSIEDHKHKHDEEIQRLKCEIDLQLSRVTKIHEKEFEVLPQAWEKLNNLLDLVRQFIRETYAISLDQYSASDLEKFLSKRELTKEEKQTIRASADKNSCYFEVLSEKTSKASWDFQGYIDNNAIFLSPDIKSKFKEAEKTIRTAWAFRNTAGNSQEWREGITEACHITQKDIPPIMKEIEELVQKRLRFHEA